MSKLPGLTVREMMRLEPCEEYTLSRVRELWGGRERCTATDILRMDIPAKDRLWAVLREEFLSEKLLQVAACDFAEHVLPLYERQYPDNNAPRDCIEVRRRYIEGEATDEELREAEAAACHAATTAAAAYRAARAAARAASAASADAIVAAYAAAFAADFAAPYHAAYYAARVAARAADDDSAECEWQARRILELAREVG
jgi:hypothetical protein